MGTLQNVELKKTRADSFPIVESVLLTDASSIYLKCDGTNSVEYRFVSTGSGGFINPNENKELVTNEDVINDTIEFTFYGASDIELTYSIGTGGSGGGGDLVYKNPAGGIIDLTSFSAGTPITFPFNFYLFFIEIQGYTGQVKNLEDNTVNNTTDLCILINKYQKLLKFYPYSDTEILATSNNVLYTSLNEFQIEWNLGATFFSWNGYAGTVSNTNNSWGDYLLQSVQLIQQNIQKVVNADWGFEELITSDKGYSNVKSIEFTVISGSVDVTTVDNRRNSYVNNYPITGTNIDIYGNKFVFGANNEKGVQFSNFSVGAEVYVKIVRA